MLYTVHIISGYQKTDGDERIFAKEYLLLQSFEDEETVWEDAENTLSEYTKNVEVYILHKKGEERYKAKFLHSEIRRISSVSYDSLYDTDPDDQVDFVPFKGVEFAVVPLVFKSKQDFVDYCSAGIETGKKIIYYHDPNEFCFSSI